VHFEPLVHLEKAEVKTHEESEEQSFKMWVARFRLIRLKSNEALGVLSFSSLMPTLRSGRSVELVTSSC
jgi:hypothetical protein